MEKMIEPVLTLQQKMRRGDLMTGACPSRDVLKHMTSRWGVLVLLALEGGSPLRFGELRATIGGISERMLAQTLKWLEQDGLVRRVAHQVVPPHVDYSLTDLGQEAAGKIRQLTDWIETAMPRIAAIWDARKEAEEG